MRSLFVAGVDSIFKRDTDLDRLLMTALKKWYTEFALSPVMCRDDPAR